MTGAITIRSSTPATSVPTLYRHRVAVGRSDGAVVADPFHLTADIVELVRARAKLERPQGHGVPGWLSRLAPSIRREARA